MQGDEDLAAVLPRFEPVEQHYDGLNGKIIQWTLENGNDNHDPSVLAFVVGPDGKVFASLMNGQQYQASAFTRWAKEQADAYARAHPGTRMPFVRATVTAAADGEASCAELEEARANGKPVLLYVGRDHAGEKDKAASKQVKAARKFEQGALDSKSAADACEGWALLRLDLADEAHARLAQHFGVTEAPALLRFAPDAEKPESIGARISGPALAALLKKHRSGD